jgi:hypothetical protein
MNLENLDESGKKVLRDLCGELSASMSRAEGERDFQKEAISDFAERYEVDKKIVKQVAKIYHRQNYHAISSEHHVLHKCYQQVFGE